LRDKPEERARRTEREREREREREGGGRDREGRREKAVIPAAPLVFLEPHQL